MMSHWRVICVVLLMAVTLPVGVASGQTALFGPEQFGGEKGRGKAKTITRTFSVQSPTGSFTLVVEKGKHSKDVSSAVIELNGVTVIGPKEFHKHVHTITKKVALRQQNTLTVELRGEHRSSIVVTVFGETQTVASARTALEAAGQIPTLDRSPSIVGPDTNGNGVRDDIDRDIDNLPDTAPQKGSLRQAYKAIERAMQVGASSATESQLRDVSTLIGRAVNCIGDRYDYATAPTKAASIEKLTVNTRARSDAYELYNTKRSGTSSQLPRGDSCDTP
jgi:hypothetical protein